ncbi:MAG: biopolymer transporter ExbD [Candidatus Omnitrophota bacterium]|nr:MAG: biopolymer transporter ExbD [Candidatus Omnitrophota bacterium]
MKFKKRVVTEAGLRQFDIAPLIDCIFLLLIFFMLTSSFVVIPGINVKLPKALSSDDVGTQTLTIVISSEDILYIQGQPKTLKEVEELLQHKKYASIFIKADRDASLGAVVGIWDACKRFEIEKIGIATTGGE